MTLIKFLLFFVSSPCVQGLYQLSDVHVIEWRTFGGILHDLDKTSTNVPTLNAGFDTSLDESEAFADEWCVDTAQHHVPAFHVAVVPILTGR